jgi:hypothetical protein
MKAIGRYDSALQMFIEQAPEPSMERLRFLRWLMKNRPAQLLDGMVCGPASGEFVPVEESRTEVAA